MIVAELLMMWYDSANGIIYIGNRAVNVLIWVLSAVISGLPMTFWINRNKIPVMLKFDDSGIAMQLKNGLVVEAGWNLVKRVKYHRQEKLTVVRLRGVVFPFTGNFSNEVNGALMAKSAGMRQGSAHPTAPTLEDQVDSRLAADFRM